MDTTTPKITGLVGYFKHVIAKRTNAKLSCFNYDVSLKHLEVYAGGIEVPFNRLSTAWFEGLREYFSNGKALRCGKQLSINSANTYFTITVSVAREAANDGFIDHKVIKDLRNIGARVRAETCALSLQELQRLVNTNCRPVDLKKAFLFSCLTGIQWKDISTLKWNQIVVNESDEWQVLLHREKKTIYVPLSRQARELIGLGSHGNKRIFDLHYSAALCVNLNKWALRAGITRSITFLSARQTFGKILLDQGVELELISELLGHKHLRTTTKFLSAELKKPPVTSNYLRAFSA